MREQRKFGIRTPALTSDRPRRKYYLIYEGVKTEAIYFDALIKRRDDVGINDIIDLVPIVRSYSERGDSHPQKILENVMTAVEESQDSTISYRTLLDWIMDGLEEFGDIQSYDDIRPRIWRMLEFICSEQMGTSLDSKLYKEEIRQQGEQIIDSFLKEFKWPGIVRHIEKVLDAERCLTYDREVDKICLIIDRDHKSFNSHQYDEVLQQCREQGFGFYLSNPCFEFWLLLHFPEVLNLTDEEREQLFLNNKWDGEKRTPKRTYAENMVRRLMPSYKKNRYDAIGLMDNVKVAIENAKHFCEDEQALKDHLGSRVGILLAEMSNK